MKMLIIGLLIAAPLLVVVTFAANDTAPTSSDVADATERTTGRRAHMSTDIRLLSGERIAGPAITIRAVPDDTASSTGEGLKAIRVIEEAAPGSVIVLSLEGGRDFAVFGATFATLAKSRNLSGFVIDGGIRGLADFRRLAMPLFARGAVPGSAGGHFRVASIGEPMECGGIEVATGDIVIGDADGVAVAPKDRWNEILPHAQRLRREKDGLLPLIARLKSYTKAVAEQAKKQ
jgi:4-hydroxy-4-methyl-2-oxoglutarate aldolase